MDPTNTPPAQPDHLPAAAALAAAAALSDQLRRRMYGFIRRAHRPVSREEAAKSAAAVVTGPGLVSASTWPV